MAVRELVENSLDAAELAGILPDVYVRIVADDPSAENANQEPKAYRVTVADNGPGVDPHHVPRAFGKVFYGSKYVLRQSRGMFGMGGTMAILYGQITTNKPVKITTSTDGKSRHIFEMLIDISENKPIILRKDTEDGAEKTGTRVDVILEGDFTRAAQKINEYFKQTALVGSYANLTFVDPIGRITTYERATESMPPAPKETLPHPYGMDVEAFKRMIKITDEKTMEKFMGNKHFHRVGETNAKKFLNFAGIETRIAPEKLSNEQIVRIVDALQRYPEFLPPDASCLSPVGEADPPDRDNEGAPARVLHGRREASVFLLRVPLPRRGRAGLRREAPRARDGSSSGSRTASRCSTTRATTSRSRCSTRR